MGCICKGTTDRWLTPASFQPPWESPAHGCTSWGWPGSFSVCRHRANGTRALLGRSLSCLSLQWQGSPCYMRWLHELLRTAAWRTADGCRCKHALWSGCWEQQVSLINLNKLKFAFYGCLATFTNNDTLIKDALQGKLARSRNVSNRNTPLVPLGLIIFFFFFFTP